MNDSGDDSYHWSLAKDEPEHPTSKPTGPEPVDESLCPKTARYKIRASGRKITPPRFEQGDFEFMVDIDPEVEVGALYPNPL